MSEKFLKDAWKIISYCSVPGTYFLGLICAGKSGLYGTAFFVCGAIFAISSYIDEFEKRENLKKTASLKPKRVQIELIDSLTPEQLDAMRKLYNKPDMTEKAALYKANSIREFKANRERDEQEN